MSARTLFVAVCLLVVSTGMMMSQPLPVRLYGGDEAEECRALAEDAGFWLAGWTRSLGPSGSANILVVKTDPAGFPVWSMVSTGSADEEAYSMARACDGGYAIAGWTRSFGPGTPNKNVFIQKLNPAGNNVWGRVYGGLEDDEVFSIVKTADMGFALTGRTYSYGPDPRPNILVMKVDSSGLLQWVRVYWMVPNRAEDEGYAIVQTHDLGYAVSGRAKTFSSAVFDPFLLKLDPQGNIQWARVAVGNYQDEAFSATLAQNGDIVVAGRTLSFGTAPGASRDMFAAGFNPSGLGVWSRTYGWPKGDEAALDDRSIISTSGGGYAVCGSTTSVGPGIPNPNFMVLKLDSLGLPTWCSSHPSPYQPGLASDVPLPMIEMSAGGYAVAGWTNSFPGLLGSSDFILSTFDSAGNRPVCAERQVPVVLEMPWIDKRMADSSYYPQRDSMFLVPVAVRHDSVCYKPETTGVREQESRGIVHGLRLRTRGRSVELVLGRPMAIELQVFAADGRLVGWIGRADYAPGPHAIALPAGIAAGAYIVTAAAEGKRVSTKAVKF